MISMDESVAILIKYLNQNTSVGQKKYNFEIWEVLLFVLSFLVCCVCSTCILWNTIISFRLNNSLWMVKEIKSFNTNFLTQTDAFAKRNLWVKCIEYQLTCITTKHNFMFFCFRLIMRYIKFYMFIVFIFSHTLLYFWFLSE